jgi:hypothetical protein
MRIASEKRFHIPLATAAVAFLGVNDGATVRVRHAPLLSILFLGHSKSSAAYLWIASWDTKKIYLV